MKGSATSEAESRGFPTKGTNALQPTELLQLFVNFLPPRLKTMGWEGIVSFLVYSLGSQACPLFYPRYYYCYLGLCRKKTKHAPTEILRAMARLCPRERECGSETQTQTRLQFPFQALVSEFMAPSRSFFPSPSLILPPPSCSSPVP